MSSKKPRPGVRGNDLFRAITLPDVSEPFNVTYWDVWFVVILLNEFEGDWTLFIDYFRGDLLQWSTRRVAEPLLNHLKHLHQRVTEAGLSALELLGEQHEELLEVEQLRAVRKLRKEPSRRQMSYWMKHTPRVERQARATSGYWDRFKPSPKPHVRPLKRVFKKKEKIWYSKGETYQLSLDLSDFLEERLSKASVGRTVAVYRAFLRVVPDRMGRIDDSYGTIGDFCGDVFKRYVTLPRDSLKMSLNDFFQDLIEWIIWENQAITHERQPAFFASLSPSEALIVAEILHEQCGELFQANLFNEFEKSLTMLGLLETQQQQFDKFVALAHAMGTRKSKRITRMAEMAETHQRADVALAVYEAALGEDNEDEDKLLRKKYEELKARVNQASSD